MILAIERTDDSNTLTTLAQQYVADVRAVRVVQTKGRIYFHILYQRPNGKLNTIERDVSVALFEADKSAGFAGLRSYLEARF